VRLRPDPRVICVTLLLAGATPAIAATQAVTPAEVDRATEVVKNDPNLAGKRQVRTLRWVPKSENKPRKESEWPAWLESIGDFFRWIGNFFGWIGETSRALMWVVIGVLVALLGYSIIKIFARERLTFTPRRFIPPTHVQDLDIRPESLPDDIGAAARALWDGGKQRAALALLYRGLLSRLVHVHEVPIRDSSTEGDCLCLAARKLDATHLDYATRLVRTWQRAIYGGLSVEASAVHELCAQFDTYLPRPEAAAEAPRASYGAAA